MIKKKEVEDNILAINSDILFETNLTKFLEHHIELTNDITVGTAKYSYKLPYGVVNENDSNNISIEENQFTNLMCCQVFIYLEKNF